MFIRGSMLLSHLDDPSISPSNCYLNTFNFFWVSFHCSLHCVCTETCAPETGGRWTWWSRIGWKERIWWWWADHQKHQNVCCTRRKKKSVGYGGGVGHVLETPSGDEEKARWGRCWRKVGGCRCWRADEHFFRWSRQAACNGDSRAPRLSLELKRVILTTLPHSHSLMLSLFSYHRKTWHQFVKTHILLIFFIFCAI